MSLILYVDECPILFEENTEKLFSSVIIPDTELNRKIISKIEQGTYNDPYSFIDRFGYKLPIDDMSMGCKAALCVVNQDQIVNLDECGRNAINVILSLKLNGSAFLPDRCTAIGERNREIDVVVDGKRFLTTTDLNYYLQNVRYLEDGHKTKEINKICI